MQRKTLLLLSIIISVTIGACLWSCDVQITPDETVELEFWHTFSDSETVTLELLVDRFHKINPHIKVNLQWIDYFSAYDAYVAAARKSEAPDIFRAEITWMPTLADAGYLSPIDDKMDMGSRADFLQNPLVYCRHDGRLWGVPQVTDCLALMYNKRLVPVPPQTFTELIEIAKPLTNPDQNKYGFCYKTDDSYWFFPFMWGFGGNILSEDNRVIIHHRESVNALRFMIDLRDVHGIVPAEAGKSLTIDKKYMADGFKSGQFAMMINGPWETANVLTGSEFEDPNNLGIANIPNGPKGSGSPTGGHNYVISSSSKHQKLAYGLIDFLSQPAQQKEFALRNNLLPTRHSTYSDPDVKDSPILTAFFKQLRIVGTRPLVPIDSLTVEYQAALRGDTHPEAALQNAAQDLRAQLK